MDEACRNLREGEITEVELWLALGALCRVYSVAAVVQSVVLMELDAFKQLRVEASRRDLKPL